MSALTFFHYLPRYPSSIETQMSVLRPVLGFECKPLVPVFNPFPRPSSYHVSLILLLVLGQVIHKLFSLVFCVTLGVPQCLRSDLWFLPENLLCCKLYSGLPTLLSVSFTLSLIVYVSGSSFLSHKLLIFIEPDRPQIHTSSFVVTTTVPRSSWVYNVQAFTPQT